MKYLELACCFALLSAIGCGKSASRESGVVDAAGASQGGSTASGGGTAASAGADAGAGATSVAGSAGSATVGGAGAPSVAGSAGSLSTTGTGGVPPTCGTLTQARFGRSARSSGFSGSYEDDYYPMYSASCASVDDCASLCVDAGGTADSCAYSECVSSSTDYCLPPTYWFGLENIAVQTGAIDTATRITMVNSPYRDTLVVSDFGFEIPSEATALLGIEVAITRQSATAGAIADYEVVLQQSGVAVGANRAASAPWGNAFETQSYGGPSDLWSTSLSLDDVSTGTLGVSLTPMYLSSGGNSRGYVDSVEVTLSFDVPCG